MNMLTRVLERDIRIKENNIDFLEVGALTETADAIEALKQKGGARAPFVCVSSRDPKIFTSFFEFKDVAPGEIKDKVSFRAFELLNMPAEKILLDYQVFRYENNHCVGLLVCTPKDAVLDCLHQIDRHKKIPFRLIPAPLADINSFCEQYKLYENRNCVVDLSREGRMTVSVFHHEQCEIFRDVVFDQPQEAVRDAEATLRRASSLSQKKELNGLYCFGRQSHADEIVRQLESSTGLKAQRHELSNDRYVMSLRTGIFKINLLKDYTLSPKARIGIDMIVYGLLMFMVFVSFLITFNTMKKDVELNSVQQDMDLAKLQYAKDLLRKLGQ